MSDYVHWDGTITLGNVLTLVVALATIIKLHVDAQARLVKIETRLDIMWQDFRHWMQGHRPGDN